MWNKNGLCAHCRKGNGPCAGSQNGPRVHCMSRNGPCAWDYNRPRIRCSSQNGTCAWSWNGLIVYYRSQNGLVSHWNAGRHHRGQPQSLWSAGHHHLCLPQSNAKKSKRLKQKYQPVCLFYLFVCFSLFSGLSQPTSKRTHALFISLNVAPCPGEMFFHIIMY